jgi:hypothetical protein
MTKLMTKKEIQQMLEDCEKSSKTLKFTSDLLDKRAAEIDNLQAANAKLEEQVTMSVGVIKYLEMQLEKRRV